MPGTIDRAHLATPRGPDRHHPTARMPKRRSAARLQGVPAPRAGIDAGGARGLASRAQGLYEPFHRALLGADGPFDLDHILAVARSVGLDAERLVRDMEAPALDPLIERNAVG